MEQACDEIIMKILNEPTMDRMITAHRAYLEQVERGFFNVESQIDAVNDFIGFLQERGFQYIANCGTLFSIEILLL